MSRDDLRPGDYVFLCFLLKGPASAYDIKQAMAVSVSNFWTAAHSQVYQQASRLARDGFVRAHAAEGARRKRLLSLTPKGRRAVTEWLSEPASVFELYAEVLVKVFFTSEAGDLRATRRVLGVDAAAHRERLARYEQLMNILRDDPASRYPASTLELGIRFTKAMIRWEGEVADMLARDISRSRPRSRD